MEDHRIIHEFWFGDDPNDAVVAQQKAALWWSGKREYDQDIEHRFGSWIGAAACGKLNDWAASARSRLALILLTDQFPRSIYRGSPKAFEFDPLAQAWCLDGVRQGMDKELRPIERIFFYLPLEHAESTQYQEQSVELYTRLFQEVPEHQMDLFRGYLTFALRHRHIIARFGRFPHRNAVLGRTSTSEEAQFLTEPGSSF